MSDTDKIADHIEKKTQFLLKGNKVRLVADRGDLDKGVVKICFVDVGDGQVIGESGVSWVVRNLIENRSAWV